MDNIKSVAFVDTAYSSSRQRPKYLDIVHSSHGVCFERDEYVHDALHYNV